MIGFNSVSPIVTPPLASTGLPLISTHVVGKRQQSPYQTLHLAPSPSQNVAVPKERGQKHRLEPTKTSSGVTVLPSRRSFLGTFFETVHLCRPPSQARTSGRARRSPPVPTLNRRLTKFIRQSK
jgi:hypothetical protein